MDRHHFVTKNNEQPRERMKNLTLDLIHVAMPLENNYVSDSELGEYDIARVKHMQVFAYWYGSGSYEGSGHAIYLTQDNKWDQAGLSHCSCYGPMENVTDESTGIYDTLDELVATFSAELKRDTKDIVDALKAKGY